MLSKMSINAAAIVSAFGLTGAPIVAHAGCIDDPCPHPSQTSSPHYSGTGAFSVANNTGVTIPYRVKWGNGPWTTETLNTGRQLIHSHPLDAAGNAPVPYVDFDRIGGDGQNVTDQGYRMEFYNVGSGQSPKAYYFKYAADGHHLNLYST
jgi:hypothetical protein